jgi:hypothetical protein
MHQMRQLRQERADTGTGSGSHAGPSSNAEQITMNPMDSASLAAATLRLVDAEAAFDRARRRLHAEQRAAVLGLGDSLTLDAAVLSMRRARLTLEAARAEWRREYGQPSGADTDTAAEAPTPAEGAEARLARWLLEASGRQAHAVAA